MTNYSSYNLIRAVREGNVTKASALISTFGLSYSKAWSGGYILLRDALKRKHRNIAKILLKHGSRVNIRTKHETDTPLHFAVNNKDAEMVAMLLDREANVDARNHSGQTPLHLSVKKNNSKIVSLLLNKNADVNAQNDFGRTPLDCAIAEGNVKIVELLWTNNARTNTRSFNGMDVLHMVAELGITKIVEHLLNKGVFVDIVCAKNGYTPLHCACAKNRGKIVKFLLKRGANINARTKKQSTALHLAAEINSDKIVKVLLEQDGVDIDAEDDGGKTVLNVAVERGHLPTIKNILAIRPQDNNEKNRRCIRDYLCRPAATLPGNKGFCSTIVKTLLSHGFGVQSEDAGNCQLLHIAVEEGCAKIVEDLLRYGADVDSPNVQKRGYTLLHNAAINKQLDIAEMLIKHGADVNAIDKTGKSPISYAIGRLNAKMTKLLVSNGAAIKFNPDVLEFGVNSDVKEIIEMMLDHDVDHDIMAKGTYGRTALWHVIRNSKYYGKRASYCRIEQDLAESLLSRGAKVNAKEESLLHIAVGNESNDMVEILLRYKADTNVASEFDTKTPLHCSADGGNEQISRMLLNAGAASNAKDIRGKTALHYACGYGNNKRSIDTLLEFGAEIDHKDNEGSTPLHIAARHACLKNVKTLLKSLADVELTDKYGTTALHVAAKSKHPKIVEELLDYGADPNVTCKKGRSPFDCAIRRYNCYFRPYPDYDQLDFYDSYSDDDSNLRGESVATANIIKQHKIKIKSLDIHDSKQNLESVKLNDEFEDFQAECKREIELMKSESIGETNISYYCALMKSINQLAMLARNKDIVEVLETYRENIPIYYKMLYYKFKKGQKRGNLLNPSLKSLKFLSIFPLPEVISFQILDMLSTRDLENVIKAVPET